MAVASTSYGQKSENRRGRGPKKGAKNAGRPPKTFIDFVLNLRNSPDAQAALRKAALDASSPNFRTAWKVLTDYDTEKPAPPKQELTGELVVRVVRDGSQ